MGDQNLHFQSGALTLCLQLKDFYQSLGRGPSTLSLQSITIVLYLENLFVTLTTNCKRTTSVHWSGYPVWDGGAPGKSQIRQCCISSISRQTRLLLNKAKDLFLGGRELGVSHSRGMQSSLANFTGRMVSIYRSVHANGVQMRPFGDGVFVFNLLTDYRISF